MGGFTTRQLAGQDDASKNQRLDGRLRAGTILQGRYQVVGTLGMGGFSAVYQARDMHFAHVTRLCAVKEMVHQSNDPGVRELATGSFQREASILATLTHPAVPDVYDFFTEEDRSYLVLEYIRGQDLEALLEERTDLFPTDLVLDWALQICDVLSYLHQHKPQPVVFRDLKPSNIMVDPYGRVRLIDFGIARIFQSGLRGTMIGTEGYSPPEQYRGESGPGGDVYALGATLHHLLTRQDPRAEPPFSFGERPIREVNPHVPPSLEAVIGRCLEYEVDQRFPDASAVREALLKVATGLTTGPLVAMGLQDPELGDGRPAGRAAAAPDLVFTGDVSGVSPLWHFRAEDEIRSTPALDGGMVYVSAYDNNLYALDAVTGRFVWKYAATDAMASSPCVYGEHLFVGSADGFLYSLRRRNGQLQWRFETKGPVYSSPRADFEHVFFGSDDAHLYVVNVLNGRQVWKAKAHSPVRSSPYVAADYVYFGTEEGYVFCVDLTGKVKWQFQARRAVTSSPVIVEDMVLIGSMDGTVYAIDANSGWALWSFRTRRPVVSSAVIHNDVAFVGSSDGYLYALDIYNGRQIWSFSTEGQVNSRPAVWENAVYFGVTDGSVYSLDARRGRMRWRFRTHGAVIGSPVVAEGIVYVGSCDHVLYALPA
jgi:outer membrane protein assembly factor BamB/tRNA A-37 threonylcarbamoyl transferase component Bud32